MVTGNIDDWSEDDGEDVEMDSEIGDQHVTETGKGKGRNVLS